MRTRFEGILSMNGFDMIDEHDNCIINEKATCGSLCSVCSSKLEPSQNGYTETKRFVFVEAMVYTNGYRCEECRFGNWVIGQKDEDCCEPE